MEKNFTIEHNFICLVKLSFQFEHSKKASMSCVFQVDYGLEVIVWSLNFLYTCIDRGLLKELELVFLLSSTWNSMSACVFRRV